MNRLRHLAASLLAFLTMISAGGCAQVKPTATSSPSNVSSLYLHCLGPNLNGDTTTVSLGSARVKPSGDLETIAYAGLAQVASPIRSLTGEVRPVGEKFHVRLNGDVGTSSGSFEGDVALDERAFVQSYMIQAGGIHPFAFVLSHKTTSESFLAGPFLQKGDSAATSLPAGSQAAPKSPTPPPLPYVYKLRVAYVAESQPAEWAFVVEGVCFKSPEALRRAIPKLLKPAVIEFRSGGRQSPGQPLTTEAAVNDLAAYCQSQGVKFRQIPGM